MKNAKIFLIAIALIFYFAIPVVSYAAEVTGCCTWTEEDTNKLIKSEANKTKTECDNAEGTAWIEGDGLCKSSAATNPDEPIGSTEKGCCVLTEEDTSAVKEKQANKTLLECTDLEGTFISGDASCASDSVKKIDDAAAAYKNTLSASSNSNEFSNPLKFNTINALGANILGRIQSVVVALSLVFIVLGGILYITSAGNEKRMTVAKGAITASMIGLAIGIAAPSFLKEIYTDIGGNSSDIDQTALSGSLSITQIAVNFLNFLLAVVGILALIMLIIGGIMYLTSAGDDDRIKTAKKIVVWSVVGISVALASLVIVKQIASLIA